MTSTHLDPAALDWATAAAYYGPGAIHEGSDIVQLKILSDRRSAGGGIAWLVRFLPPPGKLIKIVATALSDEHVFPLQGGRATKGGAKVQSAAGYTLNPKGQRHSAFIAEEMVALVVYQGEPDAIVSLDVVDAAA